MIALMVAAGAAVGAPLRYVTDRFVQSRHESVFPWGTLTVNLVACFALGALVGAGSHASGQVAALVGTGFCGALSTYSTFGFETMRLVQEGDRALAAANACVSVVGGLAIAALGWWLGAGLS